MTRFTCMLTYPVLWTLLVPLLVAGLLVVGTVPGQSISPPKLELVSQSTESQQSNEFSNSCGISGDGRYVAFYGRVPGQPSIPAKILIRDVPRSMTSVIPNTDSYVGISSRYLSRNGRYLVVSKLEKLLFIDRLTGSITPLITLANPNHRMYWPNMSADTRFITFRAGDVGLVPGDNNGVDDIFVFDRFTNSVEIVSVASDGTKGDRNAGRSVISADGRYVVFDSPATTFESPTPANMSFLYVHDRQLHTTKRISKNASGNSVGCSAPHAISDDGRYIAFSANVSLLGLSPNNYMGSVVYDQLTGEIKAASVSSDGTAANYTALTQDISADGRYVVFQSGASNLVGGDTNNYWDIFVHDMITGGTTCVSRTESGEFGNNFSGDASISADGKHVIFVSAASNLVPGDANGQQDVFIYHLQPYADYRPDLLLQNEGDTNWSGDGIYNNIVEQMKVRCTPAGIPATYLLSLQNDGIHDDAFKFAAAVDNVNGLTARYFVIEGETKTDITGELDTGDWTTPTVTAGELLNLQVELTLDDSVAIGESREVTLTAASVGNNALTDSVKLIISRSPVSSLILTASPASPQFLLTQVTLTANAVSGVPLEFQFRIRHELALDYTIMQAYGTDNTFDWQPTKLGAYNLQVRAREVGSTDEYQALASIPYIFTNPLSAVALATDPASPSPINTMTTLTATPTGGAYVEYQFRIKKSTDTTYSVKQNYSLDNAYDWTPTQPGTYYLVVWAREKGSTDAYQVYAAKSYVVSNPLDNVSLGTSPSSPGLVNTPVTLTATPTGGVNVQYQFRVKKSTDTGYTVLQAYSLDNTCDWTPAQPGTYYLALWAREQGSTASYQVYATRSFVVAAPLSAVALAAAPAGPRPPGTAVTLTATPTGGARVEYQFRVKKSTATTYTVIQNYSTTNTCPWTPTESGLYYLIVWAREVGSTAAYQVSGFQSYTVAVPLTGVTLATDPGSPVAATTPVTLTATPTPGALAHYQFRVKRSTAATYTVLQGYSADNDCTWTPAEAGTYYVIVWAREPGNTSAYQVYAAKTVVVTPP